MKKLRKMMWIIFGILLGLVALVWIGLQIQPPSFAPFPQKSGAMRTVALPAGLPAPVERFYRKLYGEQIPVIETAVITGKVSVRPAGPVDFPGRFRITHRAGQDYRHYIEAGLFAYPLFKVNERYVGGISLFESPFGSTDNDPKVNQGANLGLWAESVWLPSVFITDPRVKWEALDDQTAVLVVPFGQSQERFVVRFDAQTQLISYFESMRYHGAESTQKTLWMNTSVQWGAVNGYPLLQVGSATWMDDGKPWATFTVEDVVYNVDLKDYLLTKGS
jgi:hypothetical protein